MEQKYTTSVTKREFDDAVDAYCKTQNCVMKRKESIACDNLPWMDVLDTKTGFHPFSGEAVNNAPVVSKTATATKRNHSSLVWSNDTFQIVSIPAIHVGNSTHITPFEACAYLLNRAFVGWYQLKDSAQVMPWGGSEKDTYECGEVRFQALHPFFMDREGRIAFPRRDDQIVVSFIQHHRIIANSGSHVRHADNSFKSVDDEIIKSVVGERVYGDPKEDVKVLDMCARAMSDLKTYNRDKMGQPFVYDFYFMNVFKLKYRTTMRRMRRLASKLPKGKARPTLPVVEIDHYTKLTARTFTYKKRVRYIPVREANKRKAKKAKTWSNFMESRLETLLVACGL